MPGEMASIPDIDPTPPPAEVTYATATSDQDVTLHSQEWQALFMRKQREIEGFRKAWMQEAPQYDSKSSPRIWTASLRIGTVPPHNCD